MQQVAFLQAELQQLRSKLHRNARPSSPSPAASIDWSNSPAVSQTPNQFVLQTHWHQTAHLRDVLCSSASGALVAETSAQVSSFINQVLVNQLGLISKLPSMVGIGATTNCPRGKSHEKSLVT
jgi:hypothetical protein